MAVSLLLHALALAALVAIGARQVFSPNVDSPAAITFLAFAPPHPPVEISTSQTGPRPEPVAPLVLPPHLDTLVAPLPAPPVEIEVPEPSIPEPPPVPKSPSPAKPAVTLGTFASSASAAPAATPSATVQTAGFDAPAAVAPGLELKPGAVGTFDARPGAQPRTGTDRPGVVAAGFEAPKGTAAAAAPGGQVATGGFGATAAARPQPARREAVKAGGFDEARPVAPAPGQPPPPREPIGTPVEVLAKPTPAYTEEARAQKVEGDVVLEVEFTADGQVRVLRVVRGLGHGLDEMASRAAEKIRFKPATRAGRPVDARASLTIVFRLS